MYEGLKAVQKELGADKLEFVTSERMGNPVDAGAAIRQYADQGFDIIIAHGAQYQSVLMELAPDFPKTTFAYGTGFTTAPNIFAYDPQAQEGAYLLGVVAALMSKTGVAGIVGPVESGDAIKYNYGFQQGVAAGNPNVKVRIAYTGSFGDIVGAGELAKVHMDAKADVLTGSSQQAVELPRSGRAVRRIPMSTDGLGFIAPDHVLAAQVNPGRVVKAMIDYRAKGILGGKHLTLTFADGTLELRFNPKLVNRIPKAVLDRVEKTKQDIITGKLRVELPKPGGK